MLVVARFYYLLASTRIMPSSEELFHQLPRSLTFVFKLRDSGDIRNPLPSACPIWRPTNTIFIKTSTDYISTTRAGIDAAIEALDSLKVRESFKYSEYAEKYSCNRATLSRRHRRVQGTVDSKVENNRLLNTTQEKQLIQYISNLCRRGLLPSRSIIQNFAAQIAQKLVGQNWVDRFVTRNSINLIIHQASSLDRSRFKANSAYKYRLYLSFYTKKNRAVQH